MALRAQPPTCASGALVVRGFTQLTTSCAGDADARAGRAKPGPSDYHDAIVELHKRLGKSIQWQIHNLAFRLEVEGSSNRLWKSEQAELKPSIRQMPTGIRYPWLRLMIRSFPPVLLAPVLAMLMTSCDAPRRVSRHLDARLAAIVVSNLLSADRETRESACEIMLQRPWVFSGSLKEVWRAAVEEGVLRWDPLWIEAYARMLTYADLDTDAFPSTGFVYGRLGIVGMRMRARDWFLGGGSLEALLQGQVEGLDCYGGVAVELAMEMVEAGGLYAHAHIRRLLPQVLVAEPGAASSSELFPLEQRSLEIARLRALRCMSGHGGEVR